MINDKMNKGYRYMVYNNIKKEYQFPKICETTEKGANTLLFKFIGNDARKYSCKSRKRKSLPDSKRLKNKI